MFKFPEGTEPILIEKVWKEARRFMKKLHWGIQGPLSTEEQVVETMEQLFATGCDSMTFDVEMVHVPFVKKLLGDRIDIHVAVSYPMGRMLLEQKRHDIEALHGLGVQDVCVCLDWEAIFSERYGDIRREAEVLMRDYGQSFHKFALVIPASLMGTKAILNTCEALDDAGVRSIKVNPGVNLHVSYEEVALIQRKFPDRFDVHPAGGIRTLAEAERFFELGCHVVHSIKALEILDDYKKKTYQRYMRLDLA